MKKVFLVNMVFILLMSLSACGKAIPNPDNSGSNSVEKTPSDSELMPTNEIERAIWYGFVPKKLQNDLDKQITLSEFGGILSSVIDLIDSEKVDDWQSIAVNALKSKEVMQHDDGMLMLFYAADVMGTTSLNEWDNETRDTLARIDVTNKKLSFDYSYFSNWQRAYPGRWMSQEVSYVGAAYLYSIQKISMVSHKSIMDYDPVSNSMRESDPFTRKEAIEAALRLLESASFSYFVPVEKITPSTISAESLTLASNMPAASNQSLPKWYGSTMDNMSATWYDDGSVGLLYWKKDLQDLANEGINFLRVPLDDRFVFNRGNYSLVNQAALNNIDNLISWAIENNIHICLDLHSTEGYTTNADDSDDSMFTNEQQQDFFIKFWSFIAERYKEVPNNALSFNLLNEPHGELEETTYVALMKKTIEAIREFTPDRLIFADMLDAATTPVYGLVETGVAQSFHSYIQGLSNSNEGNSEFELKNSWPVYVINGFVHKSFAPFTIFGEFKAGTTLIMRIDGFHKDGNILVKGDDQILGSFIFGTEQVGEGYCTEINDQGTDGEWRSYNGAGLKVTLDKDVKKLSIHTSGNNAWFFIQGISIQQADTNQLFIANNRLVEKDNTGVVIHLNEDGTVTADDPETLTIMDENSLINQMQKYSDFSKETGIQVMAQEFGIERSTNYELTLKVLDAQLSAFEHHGFNWCMWSGQFNFLAENDSQKRIGATYEQLGENRWLATEMVDVLHNHMKN